MGRKSFSEGNLTYEQLSKLDLDDHQPVVVIFLDCNYKYLSNFRWCKSVYKGFSGNSYLRFKIAEEDSNSNAKG